MTEEEITKFHYLNIGICTTKSITKKEEENMKNERINILAEGEWILPVGTNVKKYNKKLEFLCEWKCARSLEVVDGISYYIYEVDFSEVEPLYPTKGMHVPKEGIGFANKVGTLVDVGENGITWIFDKQGNYHYSKFDSFVDGYDFELKRTLPKTINVCECCFKEVCECKHEDGWYPLKSGNGVCYWSSENRSGYALMSNQTLIIVTEDKINWTPINIKPSEDY